MKKNNYCTIYLVRHGVTDWNDKRLVQGHTDIPLNSEGKAQARNAAQELKHLRFDKIFSSDLSRAMQTAQIIAKEHNLNVETAEVLRERNFGYLEGGPVERLKELRYLMAQLDEPKRFSYKHHPTMESDEELMNRFLTFLREKAILNLGKTILVVSHGGLLKTLLIKLGIVSHADEIDVKNLAFLKIEFDGDKFFVRETKGIEMRGKDSKISDFPY